MNNLLNSLWKNGEDSQQDILHFKNAGNDRNRNYELSISFLPGSYLFNNPYNEII